MSALYEIDEQILECIDKETGEVIDPEKLTELQIERNHKIESVALWYKNLLSDAEQYKAEKQNFADKEAKAKAKAESLKKWLDTALSGEAFKAESGRVAITYRRSEQVIIDDVSKVNENFLKYSEPTVDKVALKKAIKDGEEVGGAHIEINNNIQIK